MSQEKKYQKISSKKILIIFSTLFVICLLATVYFIYSRYSVNKNVHTPKYYCDVNSQVFECDNGIIMISHNSVGGGTTYVENDIKTSCPVVYKEIYIKKCEDFRKKTNNCKLINCSLDK